MNWEISTRKRSYSPYTHMWLKTQPPKFTISPGDDMEIRTFFPGVDRLVAIGDVHGDAVALRSCLKLAGLLSDSGQWAGGTTHLVQVVF